MFGENAPPPPLPEGENTPAFVLITEKDSDYLIKQCGDGKILRRFSANKIS